MPRNWDTPQYYFSNPDARPRPAHQNVYQEENFSTVELKDIAIKIKNLLGYVPNYQNVSLEYIRNQSRHLGLHNELTVSNLATIKSYLNESDDFLYARRTPNEYPYSRPQPSQSVSTSPSRSAEVEELRARMFRNMQAEEARRAAMTHEEREVEDLEHMRRSNMAVRHGGRLFDSPM